MNSTNEGEKIAGTNLTPIAEYTQTAMALVDLTQRYNGVVFAVDTPKGLKEAKAAAFELRTYRTDLKKMRSELKAPVLERGRLLDAEAKRITEQLRALEDPIKAQVDAREAEIEAEKIRKAQAEQARVDGHLEAIRKMREFPLSLQGKPSAVMESRIADFVVEDEYLHAMGFEEFRDQASDAYTAALASSRDILQRQREHEAEQEKIRQERAELERMRAENERLQRAADERREADARKEREEREAAERKERSRVAEIQEKIRIATIAADNLDGMSVAFVESRKDRYLEFLHKNQTFDFSEFSDEWMRTSRGSLSCIDNALCDAKNREKEDADEKERQAKRQYEIEAQAEANRVEAARLETQRVASLSLMDAVKAVVDFYSVRENYPQCIIDLIHVYGNQYPGKDGHNDKRAATKPVRKPRTQA